MSRSFRHTPIVKSDSHGSNKEFKVDTHRVFRRADKMVLREVRDTPLDLDDPYETTDAALLNRHMRDVSDVWSFGYVAKEFGDFWGRANNRIAQNLATLSWFTEKDAVRWRRQAERWYGIVFRK